MARVPATVMLRAGLALAIGSASLVTGLVVFTPTLEAGVRSPALHVAVETAATLIAALAAVLMHGRYGRSLQRRDLVLSAALMIFAVANLGFAAIPPTVTGVPAATTAWAGVLARGFGAALMTAAAFMPAHELRRPRPAARRWLGGSAVAIAAIAAGALLAGDALPPPVAPGSTPTEEFAGHPVITAVEIVIMVLFAAAALGFTRRADGGRDGLVAWVAVGAVFATFARLHYVIYPTVVTDWFAAGDVLRLAFYLCLLAGGAAEIRLAQRALTATAVLKERQRIARDLHDGTAQDLAFILQVGGRIAKREDAPAGFEYILTAAGHALSNTRNAISDLARPSDELLTLALQRAAREVAEREGVHATVEGAPDLRVPPATREELCLLVREAVTNAIRHGEARNVWVRVTEAPKLRVEIDDDGRGFDPEAVRHAAGRFGLAGMSQRVAELGGELQVNSQPGHGTQVLVVLP